MYANKLYLINARKCLLPRFYIYISLIIINIINIYIIKNNIYIHILKGRVGETQRIEGWSAKLFPMMVP